MRWTQRFDHAQNQNTGERTKCIYEGNMRGSPTHDRASPHDQATNHTAPRRHFTPCRTSYPANPVHFRVVAAAWAIKRKILRTHLGRVDASHCWGASSRPRSSCGPYEKRSAQGMEAVGLAMIEFGEVSDVGLDDISIRFRSMHRDCGVSVGSRELPRFPGIGTGSLMSSDILSDLRSRQYHQLSSLLSIITRVSSTLHQPGNATGIVYDRTLKSGRSALMDR
jgi:hypothetical protein